MSSGSTPVGTPVPTTRSRPGGGAVPVVAEWLRATRLGLLVLSLIVGLGGGLGAVAFRLLIFGGTWLFTGRQQYGLRPHAPSLHLPWLGPWFVVAAPVLGGLVVGPLVYFLAREARGHGVPEVMVAVAENGGRIRPQVTVVKAFASAICIGSGGSVGREGPIVQIGAALASTCGQMVRMSESRLRVLVACGAAAGISATFNAPLAGVFFGFELILREVSGEAFVAMLASAMVADTVSQAFFGGRPFFSGLTLGGLPTPMDYLLCAVLAVVAGMVGVGFKTVLYRIEDFCDAVWRGRPEWLRPVVGGIALGALLLALPQMYGVGYPVMQQAMAGGYALWFLLVLMLGKMVASSLTIGIGGSGGVFAPSLFIGAVLGTAFGLAAHALFGPAAGPTAAYGIVAMGAVFAGAARAPLTSTSSVLEMTGDFSLVLPVMLGTALASAISAHLTHGTIYTTKLLRRGIDIERPKPATLMQTLTVADAMIPLAEAQVRAAPLDEAVAMLVRPDAPDAGAEGGEHGGAHSAVHALFDNETLEQALRQLVLYGHDGLPVLAEDGATVEGWITNRDVMRAFARRLGQNVVEAEEGARAAEFAIDRVDEHVHQPHAPLSGYRLITASVPASVRRALRVGSVAWPDGAVAVTVRRRAAAFTAHVDTPLHAGDVVTVLAAVGAERAVAEALRLASEDHAEDDEQAG